MSNRIKKEKKVYKKPTLTVIDLVADEVLVTNCKTSSSGGKFGTCRQVGNPCWNEGS